MRRRLRNEGIITVNDEPATWNTLVHGDDHLVMKLTPGTGIHPQSYGFRYRL